MEADVKTIIELPEFDTGQYEGCELHMVGGNASLMLHVAELPDFEIRFARVRWHRYTQMYSCEASWVAEAYFRLIEVQPSELLDSFIKSDRSLQKAYKELHHFRIFLDETGCHEFFAEAAISSGV
jgi:hypothetical protein